MAISYKAYKQMQTPGALLRLKMGRDPVLVIQEQKQKELWGKQATDNYIRGEATSQEVQKYIKFHYF